MRVVRDLFTDEEYRELITDSPRIFGLVTDYLRDVAPEVLSKVRLHEGPLPAFEEFHIVEQIQGHSIAAWWLPSGGYLVIDRTEAMTVIDVNTGKSVGKSNLEETVVNTNLEAAREVARQLRLRDIGGMIVIDFIDMLLEQNKAKVIDAMRESLAQDKSRSQVFDISPLGLLEVTRKRVSGGLWRRSRRRARPARAEACSSRTTSTERIANQRYRRKRCTRSSRPVASSTR